MRQALIKKPKEIELIAEGGKLLAKILDEVLAAALLGITTQELDAMAEQKIRACGGLPAFLHYRDLESDPPFPSTICASINEQLVHTPAGPRTLAAGDILTVDIGMRYPAKKGLYTDMAKTIPIGRVNAAAQRLLAVTTKALELGIAAARPGNHISDIGKAVQHYVEAQGFSVVRSLVGHGVGYAVHEEPRVPNYFNPRLPDLELKPGMVLAIEPMVNVGSYEISTLDDGWTVVTQDGSLCAHQEHTIAVTDGEARILTQ